MPGTNATTLAAITPEVNGEIHQFPISVSESNLIPPQGLMGPLLARENILRIRERERAVSMGMTPTSSTPGSLSNANGYFTQQQASASAGQIHGLLEASGLLPSSEHKPRGRFDSIASSSTWTHPARQTEESSSRNASTVHITAVPEGEEGGGDAWFRREGMLDGMSMQDAYESLHGEGTLSSAELADHSGNLQELENVPTPRAPSPTLATPAAAKLSKSGSLRSTLPSIRSFRNPFSFSRSASTSGATTAKEREREKSREREKPKERGKSKERGSILPIGNKNHSASSVNLASNGARFTYTPISQRLPAATPSAPTTPTAAAAFAAQIQAQALQTPPRPSGDVIIPGTQLHGASPSGKSTSTTSSTAPAPWPSPSPAMAARFGFSGRHSAGRHSMDSPVGYGYGRLGTMFVGGAASSNTSLGRVPVQAGYANGSRERIVLEQQQAFQQGHGHSTSLGVLGRVSPGPGRMSPAFTGGGGGGVTGLVRPPGLDSHMELDERSLRTERTESGYGFGGIQINADGLMLSPVDDFEDEDEDEEEVRALLADGTFGGEYESTEGHAAPASVGTHGIPYHHASIPEEDGTVQGHEPSPYPYPTAYPEDDESPDTSGDATTSPGPKLPPGLEHLVMQVEADNAMEKDPSRDSVAERDLLGELARQLRRVVEHQSTTTLGSKASPIVAHTPSSVLHFENTGSSYSRAGEQPDEFGRWSVTELKGAVERMKALIDEQEKRTKQPAPGHTRSKNSISLNDTPPPMPEVSLVSEEDSKKYISFSDNSQTTPRRNPSNAELPAEPSTPKRKESESSSSATTASTALITPVTQYDGPSFPLPTSKSNTGQSHERMESFDLGSLDADLIAMLSPNHMTPIDSGKQLYLFQPTFIDGLLDERKDETFDHIHGMSMASSRLLPSVSDTSIQSLDQDTSTFGTDDTHVQEPAQSTPMRGDLTIATIASDGFGSMRSDRSVEEIILQRTFDYDQTGVEENHPSDRTEDGKRPSSMVLDALALEPAATSSPPRKKVHTPRASSVSTIPTTKKESREISTTLFPVAESLDSPTSPSKSSPSRSPMSKFKAKDRPPLPQFDSDPNLLETNGSANQSGRISPLPSPRPSSRAQGMASALGHNRRPPSRTGEMSSIDRMRRITSGSDAHRSLNNDDTRQLRLQSITGSHSDTPISRIGLDLGPRTARAFAAAGVLDNGPSSAPSSRVATWRSASVMGYRRDGVERDFANGSGARSLASSPIPMAGAPGPSGAAARRLAVQDRELYRGADVPRARAISDVWSRPIFNRTPETALRNLNIGGPSTDPSGTSSPTSTAPPRTTLSSSTSSNLQAFEVKGYRSPSVAVETNANIHQAAIDTLKERHELEKEALLTALGEAKKEVRVERAAKEELALELTEMGVYVEELETKLGEALARMRWMEKEIGLLKDAVGVAKVKFVQNLSHNY